MNQQKQLAPVAITGIGMLTAQGLTRSESWAGIKAGREVLRPWDGALPAPLAAIKVAQCPPLPRPADLPARLWNSLARTQQLACLCADEALQAAGLPRQRPAGAAPMGCFLATSIAGMTQIERYYEACRRGGAGGSPDDLRRVQPYETLALLARRHRLTGPRYLNLTTCVGSAMALGAACDAINAGHSPLALAGGTEALCRLILAGFHSLRLIAADGCRPFDRTHPGITVGEGAALLVLEEPSHARQRGIEPLGFIRGYAATCDAYHITKPDPQGAAASAAIEQALASAGVTPQTIDYIHAHGTGTRDNDTMEAAVLQRVFGQAPTAPPVSSTKRLTGHTFAAAGAIEAALCVQALAEGVLIPNSGLREADSDCRLPLVRETMRRNIQMALSCNFAFGGNNTALVLSKTADRGNQDSAGLPRMAAG